MTTVCSILMEVPMGFFGNFGNEAGKELGSGAGRGINNMFDALWRGFLSLIGFRHEPGQSFLKVNSIRIGIIVLLLFAWKGSSCSFRDNPSLPQQVNLQTGAAMPMPDAKYFGTIFSSEGQGSFVSSNITYVMYRQVNGKPNLVYIPSGRSTCVLVSMNQVVYIASPIPPVYVVNMKERTYIKGSGGVYPEWKDLFTNKEPGKEITFSGKSTDSTPGGMICF